MNQKYKYCGMWWPSRGWNTDAVDKDGVLDLFSQNYFLPPINKLGAHRTQIQVMASLHLSPQRRMFIWLAAFKFHLKLQSIAIFSCLLSAKWLLSLPCASVGSTGWGVGVYFCTWQEQVCPAGCLGWGSVIPGGEEESLKACEPSWVGMNCWGHWQSHRCCIGWQLAFCQKLKDWKAPCSVCSSIQPPSQEQSV